MSISAKNADLRCPVCQREVDLKKGAEMAASKPQNRFSSLLLHGYCARCGIVSKFSRIRLWLGLDRNAKATKRTKGEPAVPKMKQADLAENLHAYMPRKEAVHTPAISSSEHFSVESSKEGDNFGFEINDRDSGFSLKLSLPGSQQSKPRDSRKAVSGLIQRAFAKIKQLRSETEIPLITKPIKRPPLNVHSAQSTNKRFKIDHARLKKSGS